MRSNLRMTGVLAAALLGAAAAGCVKLKNQTLVMPDGSGKIVMTFAVNEQMLKQALPLLGGGRKAEASDVSASAVNVDSIERSSEGFVAFSAPSEKSEEGWKTITLTGYFEDINRVKVREDPKQPVSVSYAFRKAGGGYVLDVENAFVRKLADENLVRQMVGDEIPPQMMAIVEPMLEGFSLVESYKMPGDVSDVKGLTRKEGRLAGVAYNEQIVLDREAARRASAVTRRTIACGPSRIPEAEVTAFKGELARAKADWAARKAAAKR